MYIGDFHLSVPQVSSWSVFICTHTHTHTHTHTSEQEHIQSLLTGNMGERVKYTLQS